MSNGEYHYTESGLDSVYLINGFDIFPTERGESVVIHDIEGLHQAIGRYLVEQKKNLSGKEIRFLRTELLLSQRVLADLLHVEEQTVARWEKGKVRIPATSDATLRLLYLEHIGGNEKISTLLRNIADIEDSMERRMTLQNDHGWDLAA